MIRSKGMNTGSKRAKREAQGEVGARKEAGDSDALPVQGVKLQRLRRHDDRAILLPHAGAVSEQRIVVPNMRVGVGGERRDFQLTMQREPVQGLNVLVYGVDRTSAALTAPEARA